MDIKFFYSQRRTISVTVKPGGEVVLRAPRRISQTDINNFLSRHRVWIEARHKAMRAGWKNFSEGENFLFLGQKYPLRILPDFRSKLYFENNKFLLSRHRLHRARELFSQWYKNEAVNILPERVAHYEKLMNVKAKRVSVRSASTRWGSCSRSGNINFSWKLVMAPLEIVDSVVVHELAHLVHHNHSKSFYALVEKYYPNYKQAKKWLNKFGGEFVL